MSIVGTTRLAARSRTVGYNTRLQMRTIVRDIHTYAEGIYNRQNQSYPDTAIKVKVMDATNSTSVMTQKQPLATGPVYGETQARGTEEPPRTYDVTLYQANWRKVIPKPGYGLRKLEADKYKLYDQHEKDLVPWEKENHGYDIRHGFLERFSPNLSAAGTDTAADCVEWWNPNCFIPTLGLYEQPTFSRTRATHTNSIVAGLVSTGGLGQTTARMLTAPVLEDLSNWCLNPRRLRPLKIPGLPTGQGFVVTVSEIQAGMMSNPTYAANNLGSQWISVNQLNEKLMKWPGVIGSYNNLLIVVDERQPTVLPSGSAAPYSLQAGYMVWDSTDLRFRTAANIKDTFFVFGNGAYAEVEGEKMHWVSDTQDYGFREGIGIAGVRGCNLPIYLDPNSQAVSYEGGAWGILDFPNRGSQA